ncbi:hypothetical protein C8R42DRAFT_677779 [Lentinula raphanica]|nr:hypothetical protein C8R42DRAFT_677779 [Lentinula raphanica]
MLNNLSTSINDDAADNYVFPRLTWIHSPSQSSRWEDYPHINICLTHSPRASLSPLVPLRFTSLSITDKTFQRHIQPLNSTAILSLLRTCSHLESFTFYGCMHSRISQSFPGVSLPRLHTLNIDESPDARVMLSKLYAPALSELCLIDLDIHYISDSLRESGDSEDDDTDSDCNPRYQSSNRATGMGLRTLIAHCDPPLKTLVMSYSNIRLKDYVHVFDRLTELEDLCITDFLAYYDMSDTFSDQVIRLLEPYALTSPVHSLNVRLPRLRRLELRSCPYMSGDAIIETVLKRVAFTDQLSSTLEVVIISDCYSFGVQHEARLMQELGPRFRSQ